MKKALIITCIMCGGALSASASGTKKATENKKVTTTAEKKVSAVVMNRANYLSDKMVRELGLNNYQSRTVRAINTQVVAQKMVIEKEFAGNQAVIDQKCKAVCDVRDRQLEDVLSTKQYSMYFGDREHYNQVEQEFMTNLTKQESEQIATSGSKPNAENTASFQ